MMQHDNKPELEKSPIQWSGQVDFQAGQVTVKSYMVHTTSDKQISRTFQGFFKDKFAFFKPLWSPYWLKGEDEPNFPRQNNQILQKKVSGLDKVVNFKDFSRPNKETLGKYFSGT